VIDSTDANTVLAGHQGQLDRLASLEIALARLRDDNVELEVNVITAETALESLDVQDIEVDRTVAAQLVGLRQRQIGLKDALDRYADQKGPPTQRWTDGKRQLVSWLEESDDGGSGPERIRLIIGLLSLTALIAAVSVHLAFLILLLPIGATSAFLWNGDDVRWQRMASQRAFEATGLKAPRSWTPKDVQVRLDEIERTLEDEARAQRRRDGGVDIRTMSREAIALELVDNESEEQALLASRNIDWDTLNTYNRHALTCMATAHNAQVELDATRKQSGVLEGDAESLRADIYRYLKREQVIESAGKADMDTLRAGLRKLAARIA
jgi:hypothetical protein